MSEAGVRKIVITGGAELTKKKRGRKTLKNSIRSRKIEGGEREIPVSVASVTDRSTIQSVIANQQGGSKTTSEVVPIIVPAIKKIELRPKKTKVILAKSDTKKAHVTPGKTRKIHLAIHGIHKNIAKAKTIKKTSRALSLDEIKKELKPCGLWKEGSKAPELMLRNIYADFKILQEKAL
jgi:hypothetical protein